RHQDEVVTITNYGVQPLTLSAITLSEGSEHFALTGLPANLATSPISLAFGESFSFGASFKPSKLGLLHGQIKIATNDPSHPALTAGVVGTGVAHPATAAWGDDFVAVTTDAGRRVNTNRVRSDDR